MVTHWLAELDGRRATVEVPATSANLGAGFDCLAVALALTNKITRYRSEGTVVGPSSRARLTGTMGGAA